MKYEFANISRNIHQNSLSFIYSERRFKKLDYFKKKLKGEDTVVILGWGGSVKKSKSRPVEKTLIFKLKKYLPQKFTNGYLGICSDGFNFLRLWQMMPKIIE